MSTDSCGSATYQMVSFDLFERWKIHAECSSVHVQRTNETAELQTVFFFLSLFCILIEYSFDQLSVQYYMKPEVYYLLFLSYFFWRLFVFLSAKWNATNESAAPQCTNNIDSDATTAATLQLYYCIFYVACDNKNRRAHGLHDVGFDTNSIIFWNFQCIRDSMGIFLLLFVCCSSFTTRNKMLWQNVSIYCRESFYYFFFLFFSLNDFDRSAWCFHWALSFSLTCFSMTTKCVFGYLNIVLLSQCNQSQ